MSEDNQTPDKDTLEEGDVNVRINEDDDILSDDIQEQSEEGTAGEAKKTPEVDYKEKFAASTTEAQRLVTENKLLQSEAEKSKGRYSALETEKAEMEKRFAEENPEKYDAVKTRKDLSELREKILMQEEKGAVDDYIQSNPKAAAQKDSLKRLGRAFPDKTYEELWTENFKPFVSDGDGSATETEAKKSQPEKGDSTMSEMVGGMSLSDFRKLPLAKRKAILIKQGSKF